VHYYNNLSNSKFSKLKSRLVSLENSVVKSFCNEHSFSLDRERYYNETLAVNLYRKVGDANDHIGIYYLDQKGEALFKFYFLKYYDMSGVRYSYKEEYDPLNVESLEQQIAELLEKSLKRLEVLTQKDCTTTTELTGS